MKKLFVAFSICAIGAVTACFTQDYVKAEETEEEYIPEPRRYIRAVTSGHIKALVVRLGFKDYPINNTNENYKFYGEWDKSYTGLGKYWKDGKWYYMKDGRFYKTFTGLSPSTSFPNKLFYVKSGIWQNTYSGKITFNSKAYNINNGKVV